MQAAAATAPAAPPRRRVYTALDPRCEWTSTEEADTLAVDVSGNAVPRHSTLHHACHT